MKPAYITVKQIDHGKTGNIARMERVFHRLTLEQIAVRMNLSKMTMCNLEYGKVKWTEARVKNFNKALKDLTSGKDKSKN